MESKKHIIVDESTGMQIDLSGVVELFDDLIKEREALNSTLYSESGYKASTYGELKSLSGFATDLDSLDIYLEDYYGNRCKLRSACIETSSNGKKILVLK